MTNLYLMYLLIWAKDKNHIVHLLNKYRISADESKYC